MAKKNSILNKILSELDDMKAQDVVVIDVKKQTTITDYMIICSGGSSRHVKAIADNLIQNLKTTGIHAISKSGVDLGEWALIDFGDFIVHIMQNDIRSFYNIEGLWGDPQKS